MLVDRGLRPDGCNHQGIAAPAVERPPRASSASRAQLAQAPLSLDPALVREWEPITQVSSFSTARIIAALSAVGKLLSSVIAFGWKRTSIR